jgi:hypothetical protein
MSDVSATRSTSSVHHERSRSKPSAALPWGTQVPLEERQVKAARADPTDFYVYVVDNVAGADHGEMAIRILHGASLQAMIDRTTP